MNRPYKLTLLAGLTVVMMVGLALGTFLAPPPFATAQQPEAATVRYTVVHTEGTNVIVTDNKSNTLYFYTVDPGSEAGSDLKLRGSLDLNQVGKQVLTPKLFKKAQ